MRLVDLESTVYERLNYATNPDPLVVNRIRRAINETHRSILGMRGFDRLRRANLEFNSIANVPYCSLPEAAVKIHGIADRTRKLLLREVSIQDVRYSDPGLTAITAYPYEYFVDSYAAPVSQDPPSASGVWVASDSTSDGSGTWAYVEGVTSDGAYRRGKVALNGLTATQVDSNISTWIKITKFYVTAAPIGTVSLYGDLLETIPLAIIAPQNLTARYTRIGLHPTPTGVVTYNADVELHVHDMSIASDEPLIPEDFHWLVESGALIREYTKREKVALVQLEQARFAKGIADMRSFVRQTSGSTANSRRPTRFTTLQQTGVYYPPGS
jgi:hypothetical protein